MVDQIASRMESLGEVGRIQVEERTARLLMECLCTESKCLVNISRSHIKVSLETDPIQSVVQCNLTCQHNFAHTINQKVTRLYAAAPSTLRARAEWSPTSWTRSSRVRAALAKQLVCIQQVPLLPWATKAPGTSYRQVNKRPGRRMETLEPRRRVSRRALH